MRCGRFGRLACPFRDGGIRFKILMVTLWGMMALASRRLIPSLGCEDFFFFQLLDLIFSQVLLSVYICFIFFMARSPSCSLHILCCSSLTSIGCLLADSSFTLRLLPTYEWAKKLFSTLTEVWVEPFRGTRKNELTGAETRQRAEPRKSLSQKKPDLVISFPPESDGFSWAASSSRTGFSVSGYRLVVLKNLKRVWLLKHIPASAVFEQRRK